VLGVLLGIVSQINTAGVVRQKIWHRDVASSHVLWVSIKFIKLTQVSGRAYEHTQQRKDSGKERGSHVPAPVTRTEQAIAMGSMKREEPKCLRARDSTTMRQLRVPFPRSWTTRTVREIRTSKRETDEHPVSDSVRSR
jgi:hypothetical protein